MESFLFIVLIVLILLVAVITVAISMSRDINRFSRVIVGNDEKLNQTSTNNKMTRVIFVLGKGGVGKSTYAANLGGNVISLDEIIRPWIRPDDSDDDYAFNVYRPGGNERIQTLKEQLTTIVRQQLTGDLCAIEGVIEDPELIKAISHGYPTEVRYLRPRTSEVFKKAMIKRVNEEYAANNLRLGRVWNKLTPEELDDYKTNGSDGELFQRFMDALTDEKYPQVDSTLPLLSGIDYCVVNIDW
jgi:hypothetical protein